MRFLILVATLSVAGCGDDSGVVADSAVADGGFDATVVDVGIDAADDASVDAPIDAIGDTAADGGVDAPGDAPVDVPSDIGADVSLPFDADGACHALGFGADVVSLEMVGSLPAMTGGVITLGSWDLVSVQTTGALTGTARGTWTFETDTTLQTLSWIALSGPPPVPTPRTESWSTEGANLIRAQTCGGSDSFNTGYTVRSMDGQTLLDVRSGTVMFTYRLR